MTTIEDSLLAYVTRTMLGGDGRGLTTETDLIASRIIDSFAALQMVAFLHSAFGVDMPMDEVTAANLQSVATLSDFVRRHQAAA